MSDQTSNTSRVSTSGQALPSSRTGEMAREKVEGMPGDGLVLGALVRSSRPEDCTAHTISTSVWLVSSRRPTGRGEQAPSPTDCRRPSPSSATSPTCPSSAPVHPAALAPARHDPRERSRLAGASPALAQSNGDSSRRRSARSTSPLRASCAASAMGEKNLGTYEEAARHFAISSRSLG